MTGVRGPMSGIRKFDVVIAGASFAGLAAAQRVLPSRTPDSEQRTPSVLLLDKDPIGAGVTSACAAPLATVRAMGAEVSIRQLHHEIVIHTPRTRTVWPLPEAFCTFDYRQFCELAFAGTGAAFIQASVLGRTGSVVQTSAGDITGRFLVDATGWRAALTGGGQASAHRWLAFGVETEVQAEVGPGLRFYFVPEIPDGYAWVFPVQEKARIGVLSYRGHSSLGPALQAFLDRLGLRPAEYHGGFLASGLRAPVIDGVFVAGDAAGQCLPVTGEGIRTAVQAGFRCGELLQDVLAERESERSARRVYSTFVEQSRREYRVLLAMNRLVGSLPIPLRGVLAGLVGQPRLLQAFMRNYLGILAYN